MNYCISSNANFKSCFNLTDGFIHLKRKDTLKSILVSFKLNSAANIITFIIAYFAFKRPYI